MCAFRFSGYGGCKLILILYIGIISYAGFVISDSTESSGPVTARPSSFLAKGNGSLNSSTLLQEGTGLVVGNSKNLRPSTILFTKPSSKGRLNIELYHEVIMNYKESKAYKPDTKNGPRLGTKHGKNKDTANRARNRTITLNKVKGPGVRSLEHHPVDERMSLEPATNRSKPQVGKGSMKVKVIEVVVDRKPEISKAYNGSTYVRRGQPESNSKANTDGETVDSRLDKMNNNFTKASPDQRTSIGQHKITKIIRVKGSNPKSDAGLTDQYSEAQSNIQSGYREDSDDNSIAHPGKKSKSGFRQEAKSVLGEESKTNSRGKSKSDSLDESKSDSLGESKSDSRGESKSDSSGESKSDSRGESKIDSRGESKSDSLGESKSDSLGESKSDTRGESKSDSPGESKSDSRGESKSDSRGEFKSKSREGSKVDFGDESISGSLKESKIENQTRKVSDGRALSEHNGHFRNGSRRRHPKNNVTSLEFDRISNLTTFRKTNESVMISKGKDSSPTVDPHAETKFPADFKVDPSLDSKNDSQLDENYESGIGLKGGSGTGTKKKSDSDKNSILTTIKTSFQNLNASLPEASENTIITLKVTDAPLTAGLDTSLRKVSSNLNISHSDVRSKFIINSKKNSPPDSNNNSNLMTLTDAKLQSSTNIDSKIVVDSNAKASLSHPESKDNTPSDPRKDHSAEKKLESRDDTKGASRSDSRGTLGDEEKLDSRGDSKGDSREVESKKDSRGDIPVESKVDPKFESQDNAKSDSRDEPKGEPHGESKGDLPVEAKGDARDDSGAEPQARVPEAVLPALVAPALTTKSPLQPPKPQPPAAASPLESEERADGTGEDAADNNRETAVLHRPPPPLQPPAAGPKTKLKSPPGEERRMSLDFGGADTAFIKPIIATSVGASYSSMFAYFVLMMLTVVVLYVVCHRKQRILACLVEGRRQSARTARRSGSRQTSGNSGYKPLPTEQDLPKVPHEKPDSVQNFVF